jgi:hypothetical protein
MQLHVPLPFRRLFSPRRNRHTEPGTSMHDWPILTSLVCIFIVFRVVKFLNSYKVDYFQNGTPHITSNLSTDSQGDSGPVGAIFTSQPSRYRPPYMSVEPRYRLDLGMALVLYVQPTHLTKSFSFVMIISQFIRSGARNLSPLYHF